MERIGSQHFNATWFHRLTYIALFSLGIFIFTSLSLSAIAHIAFIPTILYFLFKNDAWKHIFRQKSQLTLLLLIIWLLISIAVNIEEYDKPIKAFLSVKYLLIGMLSAYPIRALFRDYVKAKHIRTLIILSLIAISLATLNGLIAKITGYSYLRGKPACHAVKACGMYGMAITYGYGLAMAYTLILAAFLKRKLLPFTLPINLLRAALLINGLGMYFSYARGGIIGLILAIPFFYFRVDRRIFKAMTGGAIGLVIVWFTITLSISEKYVSPVFVHPSSGTHMLRIGQYVGATYAALENPVFGMGLRNFEKYSSRIKFQYDLPRSLGPKFIGHAHNNFFEMLAGAGFLGGALFLVWMLLWMRELYYGGKWQQTLFPFSLVFFVSGLFNSTIIDGENMFLIMGMYALSKVEPEEFKRLYQSA